MPLRPLAATLALLLCSAHANAAQWSLVNLVETPGATTDALRLRPGTASSANLNRFGFYSDLAYDRARGDWYALADRGPGGGVTRMA